MTGFVRPAPYPLRTERLTLTDLVDSDFAAMHVMDSDENVMRYIGGAQTRSSRNVYCSGLASDFTCGLCVFTGVSTSLDGR